LKIYCNNLVFLITEYILMVEKLFSNKNIILQFLKNVNYRSRFNPKI